MVLNTAAGGAKKLSFLIYASGGGFFNHLETYKGVVDRYGTGCGADDRTIWNTLYFGTGWTLGA